MDAGEGARILGRLTTTMTTTRSKVSVTIPADQHARAWAQCGKRQMSMGDLLAGYVREALDPTYAVESLAVPKTTIRPSVMLDGKTIKAAKAEATKRGLTLSKYVGLIISARLSK